MKELELTIGGMTCHHCVLAVRQELARMPGVEVKEVQLGAARVAIDEARVTVAQLQAAVKEAGYTVM